MKSRLRHPDVCSICGRRGTVLRTRRRESGYIWRRHQCTSDPACSDPPNRWTSYQVRVSPADIDPRDIRREHPGYRRGVSQLALLALRSISSPILPVDTPPSSRGVLTMFPITITIAAGAIQINQNTETILAIQADIRNISQRLDDLVVNDPAKLAEIKARADAQVERLNRATTEHQEAL